MTAAHVAGLVRETRAQVRTLSPAYFALVMATGIVSIAADMAAMPRIARGLFVLNVLFYAGLWTLTALRLVWHRSEVWEDLRDHRRSVGFFSVVAATCVLGTQCLLLAEADRAAVVLWTLGIVLWLGSTYTIFTLLIIKEDKPDLSEGITGSWLLAIVAAQSIAVLSALLASRWDQPHRLEANFLALSMWLWGGMLYIWMISLIFYRYIFFRFSCDDLEPPYWINMGAMAISTLGGATLVANAQDAWFLRSLLPFIEGFTVLFWATGTWWIPMLVILFVWRHGHERFPLTYDSLYWGAVFPLGMYTVCTFSIADVMGLDFLAIIPEGFVFVALAAWLLAAVGLGRRIAALLLRASRGTARVGG